MGIKSVKLKIGTKLITSETNKYTIVKGSNSVYK